MGFIMVKGKVRVKLLAVRFELPAGTKEGTPELPISLPKCGTQE